MTKENGVEGKDYYNDPFHSIGGEREREKEEKKNWKNFTHKKNSMKKLYPISKVNF